MGKGWDVPFRYPAEKSPAVCQASLAYALRIAVYFVHTAQFYPHHVLCSSIRHSLLSPSVVCAIRE